MLDEVIGVILAGVDAESGFPKEIVLVDAFGSLLETASGNHYILVTVDHFTKWCKVIPVPRRVAAYRVHSNRGASFASLLVREFFRCSALTNLGPRYIFHNGVGLAREQIAPLKNLLKAFLGRKAVGG